MPALRHIARIILPLPVVFILAFIVALAPRISEAQSPRVKKWRNMSSADFANMAVRALDGRGEKPATLGEMAELCGEIARSYYNAKSLHELAAKAVRALLEDPQLARHSTLNDGIDLLMSVAHESEKNPLRVAAADAIRKVASLTDDDTLKKAFFEVSPTALLQRNMTPAERDQSSPRHRVQRAVVFWLLSDRWIDGEMARLQKAQPAPPRCPPFQGTVPRNVRALSPECVEAWKEAARFNAWAPSPATSGAARQTGNFQPQISDVGSPDFEAAIDRFFHAPADLSIAELSRFYWTSGFWCGNGGEAFHKVRNQMLLMLHLRDGNLPAATRFLVDRASTENTSPFASHGRNRWLFQMLELFGLDWEKLFSSALLPSHDQKDPGRIYTYSADRLLASRGSNFAGKVLLAAQRWELQWQLQPRKKSPPATSGAVRSVGITSIARFITPGGIQPGSRPEIAREIQDELLQLLIADLARKKAPGAVGYALTTLARLQRPELKEIIRPYLDSEFHEVANQAADAMRILGEDVPRRPHKVSAAQFQIFLNDQPWTFGREANAALQYKTKTGGWGMNHSISHYFGLQPGLLVFDHDRVLAVMDEMTEARLVVRPSYVPELHPKSLIGQPWFSVPLKLPISFDAVTELRVQTQPLVVAIGYPRPLSEFPGEHVELTLQWLDAPKLDGPQRDSPQRDGPQRDGPQRDEASSATYREPAREQYEFPALQAGRYRLTVTAPGAVRKELNTIKIQPGKKSLTRLDLTPAVTFRARLKLPDFDQPNELPSFAFILLHPDRFRNTVSIATLLQDGKEIAKATFDPESKEISFPNIPPGKYQLRILGAEDFEAQGPPTLRTFANQPATAAWKRKDLPLEIPANAPKTHHAGEISLEKISLPPR